MRIAQPRARWTGLGALLVTIALWASFALSARAIATSSLTLLDAAFLRYAVPIAFLSPHIVRTLRALRNESPHLLFLLAVGGLPHFLLFAWGAHLTSAGLTGVIVPGTTPLFVALLLYLRNRRPIPTRHRVALATIVAGVGVSAIRGGGSAPSSTGLGVLLLAGLSWAIYTLALRHTRLDASGVVLVLCTPSALIALISIASRVMPSHLLSLEARPTDILVFAVLQGIGTGVIASLAYSFAVRSLGSTFAAVGGSMSPVVTALVAIPLFGEPLTPSLAAALSLIVVGVVLFNTASRSTVTPRPRAFERFGDEMQDDHAGKASAAGPVACSPSHLPAANNAGGP